MQDCIGVNELVKDEHACDEVEAEDADADAETEFEDELDDGARPWRRPPRKWAGK
jgi:hypothetical protein